MTDRAEELKNEGNSFLKSNQLQQAIDSYTEAIKLNPNNAIYYSNRAHVQNKMELFGASVSDSTRAIELDPEYLKAYYRRAIAYSNLLKFKDSIADLKTVLATKPTDAACKNLLNDLIKLQRKIAFENAIKSDDEFEELFKYKIHLNELLKPENDEYKGPVFDIKASESSLELEGLDENFALKLIEFFKNDGKLSKRSLLAILLKVNDIFLNEPVFKEIEQDPNELFTIVGDVHGQFYDLIHFFKDNGLVKKDHSYLFNGDFVDRGSWSCEVVILLYVLKIIYPDQLHLNRGNHETSDMNKVYGFEDECKYKYGDKIYKMFSKTFMELPLLTLVNNDLLIMHGGLVSEEGVTLELLKKKIHKRSNPKDGFEMELLWTDPQEEEGYGASKRGIGVQFGPDVTQRFLKLNNLKKVIRSHEVRMEGYSEEHEGGLITIFSAPNYCDSTGNKGALINVTLENGSSQLQFKQYSAQPHPPMRPMAYTKNSMM